MRRGCKYSRHEHADRKCKAPPSKCNDCCKVSYDDLLCVFQDLEKYTSSYCSKKCCNECKVTKLDNTDFESGTYRIMKPGRYMLCEDIVFEPNKENDYKPGDEYGDAYSLGFFAAITIETCNVVLDLCGYSIAQSDEFAMVQRSFACIELNDSRSNPTKFAKKCIIHNGTLCRSSDYGVRGHKNFQILVRDLAIRNFEFDGIYLSQCSQSIIEDVCVGPNYQDVPVLSSYRDAIEMSSCSQSLKNEIESLDIEEYPDKDIDAEKLQNVMDVVLADIYTVMEGSPESTIFYNESKLSDRDCHGVILLGSCNIFIGNVNVSCIKANVEEVLAITSPDEKSIVGCSGFTLRISNIKDESDEYNGTSLSDLKMCSAELILKYSLSDSSTFRSNTITQEVVDWSKGLKTFGELFDEGSKYKCGQDALTNQTEGVFGFYLNEVKCLKVTKVSSHKIDNIGKLGSEICTSHIKSVGDEIASCSIYRGARAVGFFAGCSKCMRSSCARIGDICSENGDAIGIEMRGVCDVCWDDVCIACIKSGILKVECDVGEWVGVSHEGQHVPHTTSPPNPIPNAIGIKVWKGKYISSNVVFGKRKICGLQAPGCKVPMWTF